MTQYNPPPIGSAPLAQVPPSRLPAAALATGIAGFIIPFVGLVGLILGIVALSKRRHPQEPGKGMAIGGIVTGGLSLVILPIILLMVSILLPSLSRAREAANRIKCSSNLRQIGLALKLYANENREGLFPPDLQTLALSADLDPEVFVCPSSNDAAAPGGNSSNAATWARQITHGSGFCSYIYLPGFTDDPRKTSPDIVLLYEPITNHDQDGANFLFADGHVDWISRPTAQSWISQLQAGQNPPK